MWSAFNREGAENEPALGVLYDVARNLFGCHGFDHKSECSNVVTEALVSRQNQWSAVAEEEVKGNTKYRKLTPKEIDLVATRYPYLRPLRMLTQRRYFERHV